MKKIIIYKLWKQPSFQIPAQFSFLRMYWCLLYLSLTNFHGPNTVVVQVVKTLLIPNLIIADNVQGGVDLLQNHQASILRFPITKMTGLKCRKELDLKHIFIWTITFNW